MRKILAIVLMCLVALGTSSAVQGKGLLGAYIVYRALKRPTPRPWPTHVWSTPTPVPTPEPSKKAVIKKKKKHKKKSVVKKVEAQKDASK